MAVILLDGAVGTELARRGLDLRTPLWSTVALLDPRGRAILRTLHQAYAALRVDVLTAATFRTNRRALERAGLGRRFEELVHAAVETAREGCAAARREGIRIAGSMAPLEDCYRPDLRPPADVARREHGEHAAALKDAGCDLLLVETVASAEEGLVAVEAAAATGLPVWVSAMATPARTLLDGGDLRAFFRSAVAAGAEAALLNCTPCDGIDASLDAVAAAGVPFGAYAHMGDVDPAAGWPSPTQGMLTPDDYRRRAASWFARGATIVGGCCGTRPGHIAKLRTLTPRS